MTIIYDRLKEVNVQTIILKDEVRYYAQNNTNKGCRYRGFFDLDSLRKFVSNELPEFEGVEDWERLHKLRFDTEHEMCEWINSLCENYNDLTEISII